MSINNLSLSLRDSISNESANTLTNFAEISLDSILDDGLFKEVPVLSTVLSLYKIGNSLNERHYLKKLATFVKALNNGSADQKTRDYFKQKLESNNKQRNQELEYIMILLDRYISYDKPNLLAKLYLAYLHDDITWYDFSVFSEAIDRFLPGDCTLLCSDTETFIYRRNIGVESILRLEALGLMCETTNTSLFSDNGRGGYAITDASINRTRMQEKRYKRTQLGAQLAAILN